MRCLTYKILIMTIRLLCFFCLVTVFHLWNFNGPDEIIIEGNVKGLPNGMIYLTDAYYWQDKIADSTVSKNGIFRFHIAPQKQFESYEVSIVFRNKKSQKEKIVFSVIPHLGLDGKKYGGSSAFMLEKGLTKIKGDLHGFSMYSMKTMFLSDVELTGGKQNLAYFNTNEFVNLTHDTSAKTLLRNESLIKRYPFSYFIFHEIYKNREQYTNQQLKAMIGWFDKDVQKSPTALKFDSFIRQIKTNNTSFYLTKARFFTVDGRNDILVKGNPPLTLLVFWASWCGPCRTEIPYLKSLYKEYGQKINIISISIDEDRQKWLQAVKQERMPWRQLWVGNDREPVQNAFRFSVIPTAILINRSNTEVKRTSGFNETEIEGYKKIIAP